MQSTTEKTVSNLLGCIRNRLSEFYDGTMLRFQLAKRHTASLTQNMYLLRVLDYPVRVDFSNIVNQVELAIVCIAVGEPHIAAAIHDCGYA